MSKVNWQQCTTTPPPAQTLVYVWATDVQTVAKAVYDGGVWREAAWNGDAWTTDGGRVIRGVEWWHSAQ